MKPSIREASGNPDEQHLNAAPPLAPDADGGLENESQSVLLLGDDVKRQRTADPNMVTRSSYDQVQQELTRKQTEADALRNQLAMMNKERESALKLAEDLKTTSTTDANTGLFNMFQSMMAAFSSASSSSNNSLVELEKQRFEEKMRFEAEEAERQKRAEDKARRDADAKAREDEKKRKKSIENIPPAVLTDIKAIVEKASRRYRAALKANSTIAILKSNRDDLQAGRMPTGLARYSTPWEWEELDKPADFTKNEPKQIIFDFPKGMTRREAIRYLYINCISEIKKLEAETAADMQATALSVGSLDEVRRLVSEIQFSTTAGPSPNICTDVDIWQMKAEELYTPKIKLVEADILKTEKEASDKKKKDEDNRIKAEQSAPEEVLTGVVKKEVQLALDQQNAIASSGDTPMHQDEDPAGAALRELRAEQARRAEHNKYIASKKESLGKLRSEFSSSPPRPQARGRGRGRGRGRSPDGKARGRGRGSGRGKGKGNQSPTQHTKGQFRSSGYKGSKSKNYSSPAGGLGHNSKSKGKGKGSPHGLGKNSKGYKGGGKNKGKW